MGGISEIVSSPLRPPPRGVVPGVITRCGDLLCLGLVRLGFEYVTNVHFTASTGRIPRWKSNALTPPDTVIRTDRQRPRGRGKGGVARPLKGISEESAAHVESQCDRGTTRCFRSEFKTRMYIVLACLDQTTRLKWPGMVRCHCPGGRPVLPKHLRGVLASTDLQAVERGGRGGGCAQTLHTKR